MEIVWIMLQVFDDIAVELTMALLQFFSEKPSEEHLFRTLKALSKFVTVNSENQSYLHYEYFFESNISFFQQKTGFG